MALQALLLLSRPTTPGFKGLGSEEIGSLERLGGAERRVCLQKSPWKRPPN